ncbi:MAG: acetyl-CoA carboxylase biotin carboxyl carrier protein [Phycisphaerales bacterium]|jgi:acetyl-CoA carboxylase biotin carboxyl carrier protein|nr:acetyl-CoA carboxylase biotin carboxyl carrier protein [Phycisphaerales bacterium]
MIDIRKLKELVRLMVANDLTELDLRDEQQQVSVKRGGSNPVPVVTQAPVAAAPASAAAPAAPAAAAPASAPATDDGLVAIESPMVGTYYAKPSPDKPPFLNVGDSVGEDSVVCLIEAMKIFNEIKAEQSGTIAKILVQNGDAVEFGQPLILVKPE